MNVPIARTTFAPEEFANVVKPLQSGWVVQGPFVQEFEARWSAFTGAPHSIAVSNCTTGLHLSLAALGIGPGDEVVVPAFTWVATANAVEALGARPVFVDIEPDTFNLDPRLLSASPRTRAIIPVHLFGLAASLDPIMAWARQHDLKVVEDAACGFAARHEGTHVGNFGHTGCFSFHPRKAITTGEGGMVITGDAALAERLRSMRDHGASLSDHQRHLGPRPYLLPDFANLGFNYRLTDIQASLGCSQMERAEAIHARRADWAGRYDEFLAGLSWLRPPRAAAGQVHGYQAYVCAFLPEEGVVEAHRRRNEFMEALQRDGVSTRPGTHAVHALSYYARKYELTPQDFPEAWRADQTSIAFPLFPDMTEDEFVHVRDVLTRHAP